jgi:hypothetical protein
MRKYLVLLLALAFVPVGAFVSKANAADGITPYANINFWGAYKYRSKEVFGAAGQKADTDFDFSLTPQGTTNLGVKGEKNGVFAQVELGIQKDSVGSGYTLKPRYAYMSYKLSNGLEFLAGQTIAPYANGNFNDICEADVMGTSGTSWDSWQQQVRASYMGAYFQINRPQTNSSYAASSNTAPTATALGGSYPDSSTHTDVMIPKLAAGYTFKSDIFSIGANGVFQQLKNDLAVNSATPGAMNNKTITSYLVNATFKGTFDIFGVNLHAFYGQDIGNMGFLCATGNQAPLARSGGPSDGNFAHVNATADGYANTKSYGGNIGLQVKLMPSLIFNAGIGYEADKNDTYTLVSGKKLETTGIFANAFIKIEENFSIIPEIKIYDLGKDPITGKKEGQIYNFGVGIQALII